MTAGRNHPDRRAFVAEKAGRPAVTLAVYPLGADPWPSLGKPLAGQVSIDPWPFLLVRDRVSPVHGNRARFGVAVMAGDIHSRVRTPAKPPLGLC